MQIVCRHCKKPLFNRHINHELNIVTCEYCDTVFSIPQHGGTKSKPYITGTPENFKIIRSNSQLNIEHKRDTVNILLACLFLSIFFPIFFCCMTVGLYTERAGREFMERQLYYSDNLFTTMIIVVRPNLVWIIPLIICVIVLLIWHSNIHIITLNKKGVLKIKNRPIPFPPGKRIQVGDIEQVYVAGQARNYNVWALLKNGNHSLITELNNVHQALFIEHEIEQFLGITDYPVDGKSH